MLRHTLAMAATGLIAALPALAQQPAAAPAPAPEPKAAQEVEVKGAAHLRQNDTASRTIVTREEILKFGDQSTLDVLKRLPGVTVVNGGVRMRGLGNGYTQVLVNGERAPAGFSLDNLQPDQIEKIEVIRAAAAEYSTQAIAGTINVVLRRTPSKRSREAKVGMSGSAEHLSPGGYVSMSDKLDRYSYTASANLGGVVADNTPSLTQEVRNPAGEVVQLRRSESRNHHVGVNLNLNTRVEWKTDRGDALSWLGFANINRYHGNTFTPTVTPVGTPHPYPELENHFRGDTTSLRSDLSWTGKVGEGSKLETKGGVFKSGSDRGMEAHGRSAAGAPVLDRINSGEEHDDGVTWTGKYTAALLAEHAMAVGWDASRSLRKQHDRQDDTVAAGYMPLDFDNRFDATVESLAVYARDEWDVTPGLSVYLGARWETIGIRADDGEGGDVSSRVSVLSPVAQTLWKIPGTKGDQVRLAVTRTFKAPQLGQVVARRYYTAFNTPVTTDFAGNPHLKPELALGLDAAFEHYWTDGAMVSVSATARNIDNLIGTATELDGERYVSRPSNRGTAQVRSLEFEAKFPLKALVRDAPAINVQSSLSRNWSEVENVPGPDNRLNGQARWSSNIGLDYKNPQWGAGASFNYTSGGWTQVSESESAYAIARRNLDAFVVYNLSAASKVRVTARNVLSSGRLQVNRYATAAGVTESRDELAGVAAWHMLYETRF
ncbi:MAG TPA: TonB-dependent receptor [Telluria sp.]|nr:TonB-dependent receptor [Telluria sp.]